MKDVLILGSTGSIGCAAMEVLDEHRDEFRIAGLSCHSNGRLLVEQARRTEARAIGVTDPEAARHVSKVFDDSKVRILVGEQALCDLIDHLDPDIVLVAVSGAVGLLPTLETLKRGKRLALANKESMVMAGHIMLRAAKENDAEIIPVDSEHSAIFQALRGERVSQVNKIILTASGGPFTDLPVEKFSEIRPEDALKHPTWEMGRKITIDSATMMNKALEIVEARWLFDMSAERIDVVIHRQSIVHSMVEFCDGSLIAQMGSPDMKVPIQYALTYPLRFATDRRYYNPIQWSQLTFEEPDTGKFGAIELGFAAARDEGLAGTVMNAANEIAVHLFLKGRIGFDEITRRVREVMGRLKNTQDPTIEEILAADKWAREETLKCS